MEQEWIIRLIGPLEVAQHGQPVDLGSRRAPRSALRFLATAPGRRASSLDIQEALALTDNQLHAAISQLRTQLGRDLLRTTETGYALAGQAQIWVDLDAGRDLLRQAENAGVPGHSTIRILEEALDILGRGNTLEGEDETWKYQICKQAEDMLRQCRLWLAESYEHEGRFWQAGEQYRTLCQDLPICEEALRAWMAMLERMGRPEEAIRHYQEVLQICKTQGYTLSERTLASVQDIQHRQTLTLPFVPENALPSDLYDGLEVEVIALVLHWKLSALVLQNQIHAAIRKHDMDHAHRHDQAASLSRRQALQTLAQLPLRLYGISLLGHSRVLPITEDILPLCAASITACWELLQHEPEGVPVIERVLNAYLPPLEKLAQSGSKQRIEASALCAQGHLLASALAEYTGNLGAMEGACRKARRYGQFASDQNLEAVALSRLAGAYDYAHRDIQSMRTYEEALALPAFSRVSRMLQGRIYIGLAATHAYCGETNEALALLGKAREVYPERPEQDPSFVYAGSNSGAYSFAVWEGLVLKHCDQYREATKAFLRFGSMEQQPGLLELVRAEHLNYTASVAVRERDLDAALFYLDAAESVASTIHHEQRLAEVGDTFRDLARIWRNEPKVKDLQEQMRVHQLH